MSQKSGVWRYVFRFKWIILLALILGGGFFTWRWFCLSRDDGTLADIQQRGTLRVGLDASFPPFEMIDANDRIVGLDVDIGRAIAADLGVEAEFVNIGFDGLYDALLARRVDIIISGLPYDPRWTQDVAYTRNYFNAGQMLVTKAENDAINAVEDLAGRTVAVEWGSQADMEGRRLAGEIEGLTLLRQPSAADALEALFSGQADAAIVDGVSGVSAFPRGLKVVTYLSDDWYVAAVHRESEALLAAVNKSLAGLEESGQMAAMQARWLHGQ
jgi:ABC-type amino acid transport substrate-binding protein